MALIDDLSGSGYGTQGFGGQQGQTQQMRDAFNGWSPGSYQSAIPKGLLEGIVNNGWRASPDAPSGGGQFSISRGQTTYNSDPNGNPLPSTTAPDEINYHPQGQGPGENYYVYDTSGKYLRMDKGSKVQSYASGVLSVLGAAVGANVAFGGAGAGGYSAGGVAGGGGAGAGAGAAAGGAAGGAAPMSQFGVLDTGAAQASLAGTGAGMTSVPSSFGVLDQNAAAASLSGNSGGTTFGFLDKAAAGQSASSPGGVVFGPGGVPKSFGVMDQQAAAASLNTPAVPAGSGGGGGGSGSGAGQGAAEKLGGSKLVDKLGGQLLSTAASTLIGKTGQPKTSVPAPTVANTTTSADTVTKAISAMPDPLAQQRAKKRSLIEQLGRRGRSSTVLTTPGRLGG